MSFGRRLSARAQRSELGARDRRIIDDIIRHRVLTNDAVHCLHMAASMPNATVKVTSRLVNQGWLKAHDFLARNQYFVLGRKAIRVYGLPASRTRPLGPQALAVQLALLEFIVRTEPRLRLLTTNEVHSLVGDPGAVYSGLPHAVIADGSCDVIRLIRVDLGGSPAHLVSKLESTVRECVGRSHYASLIAKKRFVLVTLTATSDKKLLIETAIRKKPWPVGVRFNVSVTPILYQLIGRK